MSRHNDPRRRPVPDVGGSDLDRPVAGSGHLKAHAPSGSWHERPWVPVVALVVLAVVLSAPYWAFGQDSYIRIHDCADGLLSYKVMLADAPGSIISREVIGPLLSTDHWASDSVFNVDSLLFVLLPSWLAYGLTMFLQRFLAGMFSFRLLRDAFDVPAAPAYWGAFLFAAFFQPFVSESYAGFTLYDGLLLPSLPLILWLVWVTRRSSRRARFVWCAAIGVWIAVSGLYAFAPYVLLVVFGWTLVVYRREHRLAESVIAVMVIGGVWALAEAPALLSAILASATSHRADWTQGTLLASPDAARERLVGLVRSNALPLLVGLLGVILASSSRKRALSASLLGTALLLALMSWLPAQVGIALPGGFQADRAYLLLPLFAALTGAVGLAMVLYGDPHGGKARVRWHPALWGIAVLAILGVSLWQTTATTERQYAEWLAGARHTILSSSQAHQAAAVALKQAPVGARAATVVASPMLHPAFASAYGMPTVDGYIALYTERYQDYWAAVIREVSARDAGIESYFNDWGSRIYLFVPNDMWADESLTASDLFDLDLLSLIGTRVLISPKELSDERLTYLTGDDRQGLWVYENPDALPLAFVTTALRIYPDRAALLDAMGEASIDELRSTAFCENDEVPESVRGSQRVGDAGAGDCSASMSSTSAVSIDCDVTSAGVLVVTLPFDERWNVHVDGQLVEHFPVDGAFIGVPLSAGRHQVHVVPRTLVESF